MKSVYNIRNKQNEPQPMFKVELEPDSTKLKNNEVHPIYNLRLLKHRKITVEEPYKRRGPVQCTNCQEYGHTQSYCTLRPVCVICGELQSTAECKANKADQNAKKCCNCSGNHTANYRGCPVYMDIMNKNKPKQLQRQSQGSFTNTMPANFVDTQMADNKKSFANVTKAETYLPMLHLTAQSNRP